MGTTETNNGGMPDRSVFSNCGISYLRRHIPELHGLRFAGAERYRGLHPLSFPETNQQKGGNTMLEGSYQLGLSDLLDQNLSCYEYYHSLPEEVQKKIAVRDIGSFEEMQDYVRSLGPLPGGTAP